MPYGRRLAKRAPATKFPTNFGLPRAGRFTMKSDGVVPKRVPGRFNLALNSVPSLCGNASNGSTSSDSNCPALKSIAASTVLSGTKNTFRLLQGKQNAVAGGCKMDERLRFVEGSIMSDRTIGFPTVPNVRRRTYKHRIAGSHYLQRCWSHYRRRPFPPDCLPSALGGELSCQGASVVGLKWKTGGFK
jgi:hypothetical protein